MGTKVLSEPASVVVGLESVFATAPASGFIQLQPNLGGIQGFTPKMKTVERDPHSKYASHEAGDIVGLDAEPKLVHDLNKDFVDTFATQMFRSNAKHAGNKGQSLYRPTAVTATGYTVPALGDLTAGLLIFARGFTNSANNGLKPVAAASVGTEIKAAGLVAEAAPPSNVTVGVAGVQGAAGDITLNGSGNLTSTIIDFTLLGLQPGQELKIGDLASGAAFAFATAAYNGHATVVSVTANLITLTDRSWTVGAQDLGAAKTIRLLFSRFYRNRTLDDADYIEPSHHAELEDIDAGTAGTVPAYTYAKGMGLKTMEIDAPLENKIVCTASFCASDIPDPVLTAGRVAGPSTAFAPLATALLDTATDLKEVKLYDATGNLLAEVNSWRLTYEHGTNPRKVQGQMTAIDHNYGKYAPSVTMEVYFTSFDQIKAVRDNRPLKWQALVANHEVGLFFKLHNVRLRGGDKAYAANQPVMLSASIPGFRDMTTNLVQSMSVFEYYPAS